jgi:hypothetical protein
MMTPWQKLLTWVGNMTDRPVIRMHPNAPAPTPPYVVLDVIANRELGTITKPYASTRPAVNDKWQLTGGVNMVFTLRIQAFGTTTNPTDARDIMEGIQLALKNTELHADILHPNVAMQALLAGTTDVTGLLDSQYQGRAFLDVQMGVFVPFAFFKGQGTQTLEVIERVTGEGQLAGETLPPLSVILDTATFEPQEATP